MTHRTLVAAAALVAATLANVVAPAATGAAQAAPTTTKVTFHVKNCDGCKLTVVNADVDHPQNVWTSPEKKVVDDAVSFRVPTGKTHGLSVQLDAPWEGNTGYITLGVFRYAGEQPGDRITFAQARDKHRASGCWAGTDADTAAFRLVVRKVKVQGNQGKTQGTIAFVRRTQEFLKPMNPAPHGVLGTQEPEYCQQ